MKLSKGGVISVAVLLGISFFLTYAPHEWVRLAGLSIVVLCVIGFAYGIGYAVEKGIKEDKDYD